MLLRDCYTISFAAPLWTRCTILAGYSRMMNMYEGAVLGPHGYNAACAVYYFGWSSCLISVYHVWRRKEKDGTNFADVVGTHGDA